ncbi:MAG: HNH endonuclease [Planctomycetaceae bacterium]|nr:HNH endonuclease [Planctomycetaceae bacterium]
MNSELVNLMPESRSSQEIRDAVFARANYQCEYCQTPMKFCPDSPSLEHIEPKSKRGSDDMSNLAMSCQGCNSHKFVSTDSIDPESGRRVPLYNPRRDEWNHHFRWSPDLTVIIGRTSSGRATIKKLQPNRPALINLKLLLCQTSRHPAQE